MYQVGRAILSRELLEEHFLCDLNACKGACCVHGDAGAPLEEEEVSLLEALKDQIAPFLRPEGAKAIAEQGTSILDADQEPLTPLVEGKECAYVIFEQGKAKCAIEKAFEQGVVDFQKPISCHLYPIRITAYKNFDALNYHRWEICQAAVVCGKKQKLKVYEFLEKPLVRKYGEDWYRDLLELIRVQM